MKNLFMIALAAWVAVGALPAAAQEEGLSKAEAAKMEREEKRLAADWMKTELNNLRKTVTLLKKIKNAKTVAAPLKEIQSLYGISSGVKQTAMGEAGPASKPTGAAYEEQEKKNASTLKKVKKEISAEMERIKALELGNSELESAFEWLEENRLSD